MEYSQEMKDGFKQRLKKIIGKKIETTMIASLSQFETAFGHTWGHGKDESLLTPDELVFKAKWKEVRDRILNIGNQQKRNSNAEIDMHEVHWNRYRAEFIQFKDNKENI